MPDRRSLLIAASYVVVLRDGKVLLQRRQNTGYMDGRWALLAGHVDPGETAEQAAIREAREEAGIEVTALTPLTTLQRIQIDGPQLEQRLDFFYRADEFAGEPTILEPTKSSEMGWFPLDGLPEDGVPHEALVLRGYADGSLPPVICLPR